MSKVIAPIDIFKEWFEEAKKKEESYPEAIALATVSSLGMPDVRMVLMKSFDERGFVFFTNYQGKKAQDIEFCSQATICFYWKSLQRQIRISGTLAKTSGQESDDYFQTRPRLSQIGAWASKQSEVMSSEYELEKRVVEFTLKFHVGPVPRPPQWGGYRLSPQRFEFWEERPSRIHRRREFLLKDSEWTSSFIFP
ncbi:MAG: pyridoxamine 5'-phosphate oxidase [Deltaproteobacteria bacterium]|nr:pyridoxamine 5'-phosphate oxidase [Deltaproteobacteria bacterium]